MTTDYRSSDLDQPSLILNELAEKIYQLPAAYRDTLAPDLSRLQKHLAQDAESSRRWLEYQRGEVLIRALARHFPRGGIYIVDRDLRCQVAQGDFALALGLSREMAEGRTLSEVFSGQMLVTFQQRFQRALHGETAHYQSRFQRRTLASDYLPLYDESGQVNAALAIIFDITERIETERFSQVTNEINQILHSSLDHETVMRSAVTAAALALDCDTAALSLREGDHWRIHSVYGLGPELVGQEFQDEQEAHAVLAIETQQPVAISDAFNDPRFNREHMRQWNIRSVLVVPIIQHGTPLGVIFFNYQSATCEFQEVHLDFSTRLAASLSLALENASLFNSLQQEIAERKRIEAALRESEEAQRRSAANERARAAELEALMDTVPAIIWISRDAQCQQMTGNRFGYEFLRMGPDANLSKTGPADEVNRQPYFNMKDGRPLPGDEMPMQIAAASGTPARDYEFELVFRDGAVHSLLGNVNPLFDAGGQPAGAVAAFVDISNLRQLEAQQIEAKAQMEVQRRLMEYREQERQGIAHDIHDGPIQTLSGTAFNIQFVKEAFQDPTLRLELEQININVKNAVRELREIVNDLRPPSLIRFGLARTIRMHTEDILERHPELTIDQDLSEDDTHLSEQACLTLFRIYQEGLNNVLRHSGATALRVTYLVREDEVMLELRDNGIGFSIAHDLSTLTGAGHFGLAGMKERAESIGGELTITSAPGQGTVVRLRAPLLGKNLK